VDENGKVVFVKVGAIEDESDNFTDFRAWKRSE